MYALYVYVSGPLFECVAKCHEYKKGVNLSSLTLHIIIIYCTLDHMIQMFNRLIHLMIL